MYTLRPYQQDAVDATLAHFRKSDASAVLVLPTGAGKSLVIAELARIARGKVLVVAHVKELVEQNHQKFVALGQEASIFSAGLGQKDTSASVIFASIQSIAKNLIALPKDISLLVIDECHRVSEVADADVDKEQPQYQQLIQHIKQSAPKLKVLGLTATPYRLQLGWIYRYHYRGFARPFNEQTPPPFEHCIYELPLSSMIRQGFLTPPKMVDAALAQFDPLIFEEAGATADTLDSLINRHRRVTEAVCEQIVQLAESRQGVMIFAASVNHAKEILGRLPSEQSVLITGATPQAERDEAITRFKQKDIKFLVNVSVLTTGFDAPHVDMIAILRRTESVSLFQQIVGRGLRLAPDKEDCLVIDYAGNGYDIHQPEVGEAKPNSQSVPVQVFCPACEFANIFWGITDDEGHIIEHFGRRCQGLLDEGENDASPRQCDYRFVFKQCSYCLGENDIAARECQHCHSALIDPDKQLKDALQLKDAKVIRCAGVSFEAEEQQLKVTYHDEDGDTLSERFFFNKTSHKQDFNLNFGKRLNPPVSFSHPQEVTAHPGPWTHPDFVIARKQKYYWVVKGRIFDYQGRYRKANQLG